MADIYGTTGNDVLEGSADNDYLVGDSGNDIYLFGRGSGQDILVDYDLTVGIIDTVRFAADVLPENVRITRNRNDVILSILGTTDTLTLQNFSASADWNIERIEFADGTVWSPVYIQSIPIVGTDGNDYLYGSYGDDTLDGGAGIDYLAGDIGDDIYLFGRGSGQDTLVDYDITAGNVDTVWFMADVLPGDVTIIRIGNDVVLSINGTTDTLTLRNFSASTDWSIERFEFSDGTVWEPSYILSIPHIGTDGNDNLLGSAGDDVIQGLAGDDYLTANGGNDILIGGQGNDYLKDWGDSAYDMITSTTYVFNLGDGQDTIYDYDGYLNDQNTLQFGFGINPGDIVLERSGDDLVVNIVGTTDKITIKYWSNEYYQIENIIFADGTIWDLSEIMQRVPDIYGTEQDDWLIGWSLPDTIYGLGGNDYLAGGSFNDLLDGGIGDDTMIGGAGDDTYVVDSVGDEVREAQFSNGYYYDYGGRDTVQSSISYTLGLSVENLTLTGTRALSGTGNELDNTITGNAGNNILAGGLGNDSLSGGDGSDRIDGDEGDDIVEGQAGNDLLAGGLGNDLVFGGVGDDTLSGNDGDDNLVGEDGNDQLDGGAGSDILDGGAGNDRLYGGAGNNVLLGDLGDDILQAGDEGDILDGGLGNDNLAGGLAADVLLGQEGDDLLDGGAEADTLMGGAGNDTYVVDNVGDVVMENADEGVDSVRSSVNYMLGGDVENLTLTGSAAINGSGNELGNIITGNSANNLLDGGLGADTLVGGLGNDSYLVDDAGDVVAENAGEGSDGVSASISYTLGSNVENLSLSGSAAINGTGNAQDNLIIGNSANNTLAGGAGNDTLDGGAGVDTLIGGLGNDSYLVDNSADVLTEALNEGADTVSSSANYTLGANLENLTLTGSAALNGTGNALANTLTGNAADNQLDGGVGADTLAGGLGNDSYGVDNAGDVVIEAGGAGIDTVRSGISYTLGNNVENLSLTGTGAISGTGNTLDNLITGNTASNTLTGGAGNDILDGGLGADTLVGGTGNDTYVVDNAGDAVSEAANAGTDSVSSSVTYTLAANVENLGLSGAAATNGTGNALANVLTGNAANNVLDGGAGADSMLGGAGNDNYLVDNAGDMVTENAGEGIDSVSSSVTYSLSANLENLTLTGATAINGSGNDADNVLTGNGAVNTLNGGAGDDALNGGAGADKLLGGVGNDSYVVDNASDVIVENLGEGVDSVTSSVTYTLAANLENLSLTGTTALNGIGNAGNNTIVGNSGKNILTGNAGNDYLDGKGGTDTMSGGADNDTYVVDNTGDVVTESAGQGNDGVISSVSYTLGGNVENLTLSGTTAINGTGNTLANIMQGNDANNTLTAGAGDDTLTGGGGNDTLSGGAGNDIFVFRAGSGADRVTDFDADPLGGQDLIDANGLGINYAGAYDAAIQNGTLVITDLGADTLLSFGSDSIRLVGVGDPSTIDSSDFLFYPT
jgi:trimeric autotransporter adhesin